MLLSTLLLENSQKYVQKYEPVIFMDPIPITLNHLLLTLLLKNSPKNVQF